MQRLQDHLVGSNLVGHDSHGVRVIPNYVDMIRGGDIVLGADMEIVTESPTHAVLDGNWGVGQLMGWRATQLGNRKGETGGAFCGKLAKLAAISAASANIPR